MHLRSIEEFELRLVSNVLRSAQEPALRYTIPFMAVYLEATDRLAGFSSNVSINDIAPSLPLIVVKAGGKPELAACPKQA
jgi:hypothetical protein